MPQGRGEEWVECGLCEPTTLRRVQAVYMSIPPLPVGPLSVREFRVDACDEKGAWRQLPFIFSVDNRNGMQRFPIGAVDAHSIRVVCLANQISAHLATMQSPNEMERVGFYALKFD